MNHTMFSKLAPFSQIPALALTAASSALADPMPGDKEVRESVDSKASAQIDALQCGNPHTVGFKDRHIGRHSPTNDEINAAEVEDPNSVDYPSRKDVRDDDGQVVSLKRGTAGDRCGPH